MNLIRQTFLLFSLYIVYCNSSESTANKPKLSLTLDNGANIVDKAVQRHIPAIDGTSVTPKPSPGISIIIIPLKY